VSEHPISLADPAGALGRRPGRLSVRALRAAVGAAAIAVALGACSSGSGSGSTGTVPPLETTVPGTGVPATAVVRLACTPAALGAAAAAAHPAPSIAEASCDTTWGVATINSADLGGEQVAFFRSEGGAWVLVSVGAISGDVAPIAPKDFPAALLRTWRFRFDTARAPTTTTPPSTDVRPNDGSTDGLILTGPTTTTTLPPTTTTTTTTPPPTEPTASPFCQLNPQFPDCRADPFFPGP
jgi:hypothetical protein